MYRSVFFGFLFLVLKENSQICPKNVKYQASQNFPTNGPTYKQKALIESHETSKTFAFTISS